LTETIAPGTPPANGGSAGLQVKPRSEWQMIRRRFFRHRMALAGMIVLIIVVAGSLIGGRLWVFTYDEITPDYSTGPTWDHPMGTDGVGHDVFAMVLRGSQKSVQIMLLVALFSTVFGVAVGAIAGYYRGWIDSLLMRTVDLILTIPTLAVLLVLSRRVVNAGGGGWVWLSIIIAALVWTPIARIVRAEVLSVREKEFVEAARAAGATNRRIIVRHILPNIVGSVIVAATLTMASAILIETTLSYLGLGVRSPDTSLGRLVADGQTAAQTRPWLFYFPGFVIIVIVLCVNFIGDGLRDAFDPKQTRVRA
jgi:ABC-type dipeptide/oligopeptide/nickel transport system permease subunit